MYRFVECIDAGSDFCPCHLAEKGECIICSQLQNKVFCDCLYWKGTCIYQELLNNGNKAKKNREYKKFDIVSINKIRDDLHLYEVKLTNYLVRELDNFGAFVFIKRPQHPDYFGTPISIMDVDYEKSTVTMLIKIHGVKTKDIVECSENIMLKGPYWNGIQGQRFLRNLKDTNVLILGRGVAASPGVLATRRLKINGNNIKVMLDKGRSQENACTLYYKKYGADVENINIINYKTKNLTDDFVDKIDDLINKEEVPVILTAGDDDFNRLIINYIYKRNNKIYFASVNNHIMCCGEGVCGSCQIKLSGKYIRSCKQQYNPIEYYLMEDGNR
ncbi:MAG: sulfide/dihydroorotate dehydrogenase-like FAD/NAD-binding protein [Caloramator sp.]|nr:sulfide/dihydroorotate dehydrogenase-like FAD/NAD-binding protein [Caloramator sp.]